MEKVLSLVLQAIALAPGAGNTEYLRDFCIDNGMDDEAIDGCLTTGSCDIGAVNVALQLKEFRDDALGSAGVERAKKAAAKVKKDRKDRKAKKAAKAAQKAEKEAKK